MANDTNKPTIVFLHGVGNDRTVWDPQVAALEPHANVVTYDLLGHGETPKPDHPITLMNYVDQLNDVLDGLGVEKASLVGFSFGGLTVQLFASLFSHRIERLVIMGAVYKRTPEQVAAVASRLELAEREGPQAIIAPALERWFDPEYRKAHPEQIAAVVSRLERNIPEQFLAAYRIFVTSDGLVADRLCRISVPTLVIAGELDPGSTPAMAERMVMEIPDARLKVIPGARHMLPMESADEVNAALIEFLVEDRAV